MTTMRTFLGIGAQKAGTTALTRFLANHPEVYVPAIKEMHFFDLVDDEKNTRKRLTDDIRRRYRRLELAYKRNGDMETVMAEIRAITDRFAVGHDPEKYREMLMQGPTGTRICGEFTPAYAVMNPQKIARIAQVLDRPRILFILRNPADRFLSQVSHAQTHLARDQDRGESPLEMLKRPGLSARSDYNKTLRSLDGVFPAEDVFIGFFEDLVGPDAPDMHKRICTFLDIDPAPAADVPAGKPVTPRPCNADVRDALVQRFASAYRMVQDRMGTLPQTWQDDLKRAGL